MSQRTLPELKLNLLSITYKRVNEMSTITLQNLNPYVKDKIKKGKSIMGGSGCG